MGKLTDTVIGYLDDSEEPLFTQKPPLRLNLDTRTIPDGDHVLRVEAWDLRGHKGIHKIPFTVRNGPAITVQGLGDNEVVDGQIALTISAYGGGGEENWEPSQAETPAPVPTWAWVLLIFIITWAMYYAVMYWKPEKSVADSPTYQMSEVVQVVPAASLPT
ncbi:MAG: hypothetical protein KC543_15915 [Myxococcales bacterium]|nr:hypothetical protein [Myxococcales bacterium]